MGKFARSIALGTLVALAGCSAAPHYRPPAVTIPVAFKESGPWTPAAPALAADTGWWTAFHDPTLDGLEDRIARSNPTLQVAVARFRQAQGYLGEVRADLLPQVGAGATISQNRQSARRPLRGSNQPDTYAADTIGGSVSWDLDLWGGLSSRVAAGRAEVAASADDLAAIRLSLESQLALDYFDLRGLDEQAHLLDATIDAYTLADDLIARRFKGGIASSIDVARSGALLADARAQRQDIAAARALVEHAIASLTGEPASTFALAPTGLPSEIPAIPVGVPSTVLQRRPDVAAAERRMAEANAGIGVARAAFFPSIGLGGGGGFQSTALAGLIAAPNAFWSIGPSVALSIFDGGRRRARLAIARAVWDQQTAEYRARVLQAFQDVEDGLAQLHHFADEARSQADAVRYAGEAEQLALNRYEKGVVTYLDVSTAQAAALQARRRALDLETKRLEASVRLIRAIGGGWQGKEAAASLAASNAGEAQKGVSLPARPSH